MSKLSKRFTRAWVVRVAANLALALGVMVLAGGYPGSGEARTLQATAPDLGVAESFGVLAAAGVTNTGPTVVDGDLGTHPTAAVTGFFGTTANDGPGTVTGEIHQADDTALAARNALKAAYSNAAGQPTDFAVGTELGGETLVAGVYESTTGEFGITAGAGPLTLNGDADDVWVFKAGSTLTTSGASSIVLSGGAQACNVFWQIGSSATLGASSTFVGTIMAHTSISVGNNATVEGRLLAGAEADSGAVTLDDDTVTVPACAPLPAPRCIGNIRGQKVEFGTGRPIGGVTIELVNSAGGVIASTLTKDNGDYDFLGLEMGTYIVREVLPAGLEAVDPASGARTVILSECDQNVTGQNFQNRAVVVEEATAVPTATPPVLLPVTGRAGGSSVTSWWWMLGGALLAGASGLVVWRRREQKK